VSVPSSAADAAAGPSQPYGERPNTPAWRRPKVVLITAALTVAVVGLAVLSFQENGREVTGAQLAKTDPCPRIEALIWNLNVNLPQAADPDAASAEVESVISQEGKLAGTLQSAPQRARLAVTISDLQTLQVNAVGGNPAGESDDLTTVVTDDAGIYDWCLSVDPF
jgi:hypothetical protein